MRGLPFATVVVALGLAFSISAQASESLPKTLSTQLPYPAGVSLVQDRMGWTYRQSSTDLPLYLYEKDSRDKSVCNSACETQWIPLLAPTSEKSLGEWTIFVRKDGRRQWAFEQRPVYTHIHDAPDSPTGDGEGGVWHLMPHFRS